MKKIKNYFILSIQVIFTILLICLLTISSFFVEYNNIYFMNYNPIIYKNPILYQEEPEIISYKEPIKIENQIDIFINKNIDTINFYSNTFQIDINIILDEIYIVNNDKETLNYNNMLNSDIDYDSFDQELFFYISNLLENNSELFSNKLISFTPTKDYILGLIDYYSKFFPKVDTTIAKSIIHIESGFTASSMISKNNLFGGMSNGSLIKYKTIEYGIYSYMKLLNNNYFGIGLTTVNSIGKKYNPVYENGVKIANPNWVSKVNNVIDLYNENNITIEELLQIPIEK